MRKGLILLVTVSMMCFLFSGCGKKKKELTLDDLKKMDPAYEGLCGVSYYHGGGMEGSYHSIEVSSEDGKVLLTYEDSNDPGQCRRIRVYDISSLNVLDELDAMVKEYNMSVWDCFPESEYEVLDAPGTGLTLYFRPEGEKYLKSVHIDYDKEVPGGCFGVLHAFMDKVNSCADDSLLTETYLKGYDDQKIRSGREVPNTEEEIELLCEGYWRNGEILLMYYPDYGPALTDFNGIKRRDYVFRETVAEPLGDHDCSWHRILVNEEDENDLLYMTMDSYHLYVEDADGNGILLDRE